MRSFHSIIGESWSFASKQPSLFHVALWLLFLPMLASASLSRVVDMQQTASHPDPTVLLGTMVALLALTVFMMWGALSVLIIGKRLLASKAGRTRTSFKAVAVQARGLLIPYMLTSFLRSLTTLLWCILLIVPGIIYSVRTIFFGIVMVTEDVAYRPALRRSIAIIKGSSWHVFWMMIALSIVLYMPIQALIIVLTGVATPALATNVLIDCIQSLLNTLSTVLFMLSMIVLYGELSPPSPQKNSN